MKKAICFIILFISFNSYASEVSFQVRSFPEKKLLTGELYLFEISLSSANNFSIIDIAPSDPDNLSLKRISLSDKKNRKILNAIFISLTEGEAATGDFKITVLTENGEDELLVPGKLLRVSGFIGYYAKYILTIFVLLLLLLVFMGFNVFKKRKMILKQRSLEQRGLEEKLSSLKKYFSEDMKKTGQMVIRGDYKEAVDFIDSALNKIFQNFKGNNNTDITSINCLDDIPSSWHNDISDFIKERDRLLFAGNDIKREEIELLIKKALMVLENREGLILKDNNLILKD